MRVRGEHAIGVRQEGLGVRDDAVQTHCVVGDDDDVDDDVGDGVVVVVRTSDADLTFGEERKIETERGKTELGEPRGLREACAARVAVAVLQSGAEEEHGEAVLWAARR